MAKVHAPDEGALLSDLREGLLLRRGLEEGHCIVAEDASQNLGRESEGSRSGEIEAANHDHRDGEEDPPTVNC